MSAGNNVQREIIWGRGIRSKQATVLNKVFKVNFIEMVTFEKRLESDEGNSHMNI